MTQPDPAPVDDVLPVVTEPRQAPWTLDELSAGLESLAGDLEAMGGEFATAVEDLAKADVTTRDQLAQLREQVARLVKQEREQRIEPRHWAARAETQDWDELVTWVDWLQASYGALSEFGVHPCWPAHPGVVEELAGLYHSWRHAQLVDEISARPIAQMKGDLGKRPGSSDLIAWHDRWLWPFLHRIKGGHYRILSCREKHEPERLLMRPTDRSLLPPAALPVDDQKSDL